MTRKTRRKIDAASYEYLSRTSQETQPLQKLAALPLAIPACIAVLFAAARGPSARRLAVLAVQATLFLLFLYAATPPAWREPFAFAIADLKHMSQHLRRSDVSSRPFDA